MNVTSPLSKTRGIENLVLRIIKVLVRFGITSKSFEHKLDGYNSLVQSLCCVPTFGITAVTLARHPAFIRELSRQHAQFAVHGYIHTDYSSLSQNEQDRHFKKAIDTFQECQIPFMGFRAPFLRTNDRTHETLRNLGFIYDSSHPIHWNVIDRSKYPERLWSQYDRLIEFYNSRNGQHCLALPKLTDGLIEIPVSIPDDEMLIDRLGITDREEITRIWRSMLQITYGRGELFTMSLHPERIFFFENALVDVIQQAKRFNPPVWIATLREIAEWWEEREKFSLEVDSEGNGRYRVKANCSEKATLLFKNCKVNAAVTEWSHGYGCVSARDFIMDSPIRPVIGVSPDSSSAALNFLKSEGYVVERRANPDNFGIYLGNLVRFQECDEKSLSEEIEKSDAPLIRYWRWPNRAMSALSITGDIDSITLIDFMLRVVENLIQDVRSQLTGGIDECFKKSTLCDLAA